jgi:hypothetical protein
MVFELKFPDIFRNSYRKVKSFHCKRTVFTDKCFVLKVLTKTQKNYPEQWQESKIGTLDWEGSAALTSKSKHGEITKILQDIIYKLQ